MRLRRVRLLLPHVRAHRQENNGCRENRYSYLQLRAGQDGEHIGNLFLKDYSQYSPHLFYVS